MPSITRLLTVGLLCACATETNELGNVPESTAEGGVGAGGKGSAGSGAKSTAGVGGSSTSSAGTSHGGSAGSASAGRSGGVAGDSAGGGGSEASSGAAGAPPVDGPGGTGGAAGACDEASAQPLPVMQSLVVVGADACLKIEFNADQLEWVQSVTVQPSAGTYPFTFTWSNCGADSAGEFGANYGNQVLSPVDPSCAVLIRLTGPGQSIELQWWAS